MMNLRQMNGYSLLESIMGQSLLVAALRLSELQKVIVCAVYHEIDGLLRILC